MVTEEGVELKEPIRIRFVRHDMGHEGEIVEDEIRAFFMSVIVREPFAPNEFVPHAVLTEYTHIPLKDIVEFIPS